MGISYIQYRLRITIINKIKTDSNTKQASKASMLKLSGIINYKLNHNKVTEEILMATNNLRQNFTNFEYIDTSILLYKISVSSL